MEKGIGEVEEDYAYRSPIRHFAGQPGFAKLLKLELIQHLGEHLSLDGNVMYLTKDKAKKIASTKGTPELADAAVNIELLIRRAQFSHFEPDSKERKGVIGYNVFRSSLIFRDGTLTRYVLKARVIPPQTPKGFSTSHLYFILPIEE